MNQGLKHQAVFEQIKNAINSGKLQPGTRLQNETDLAETYGVSVITIRRAMTDLVAEGYVSRKRGAGTFVAQTSVRTEPPSDKQKLFVLMMNQESYSATSIIRIIEGAQRTFSTHHANMLIDWNSTIPKISAAGIERMLQQSVDGFLIYPFDPRQNREEFQRILNHNKPYVLLDRHDAFMPSLYVGSNNFDGGILATNALIKHGHERLCFVAHLFFLSSEQERYAGFLSALHAAGIQPGPHHLMAKPNIPVLAQLIRNKDITAIFCASDRIAENVVHTLTEMGLQIPEDVSVIGFDDNIYTTATPVPLSTVRQNFDLIGQRAAELLLWSLDHRDSYPNGMQIQTGVELVLRSSIRKI